MNCKAACGSVGNAGHKCNHVCRSCGTQCHGKFIRSLKESVGKEAFICKCTINYLNAINNTNPNNNKKKSNDNKKKSNIDIIDFITPYFKTCTYFSSAKRIKL